MLKVFRFLKHNLIAVIGAVTLVSITAYASGLWSDFPILNGASYCNSFIAVGTSPTPGGTNAAGGCVSTIPAGPTMTGLETIPADTNATQGQTATVKINLATLGVGPYVYVTPITGATLTLTNVQRQVIIDAGTTIGSYNIGFPAATSLLDAQEIGICTTGIVTTLTLTAGTGTTIKNAPTALVAPVTTGNASCVQWVYVKSQTAWFRFQ